MTSFKIEIEKYDWAVYLFVDVKVEDCDEVIGKIKDIGCRDSTIALRNIKSNIPNQGFTYTNMRTMQTVMCIGFVTDKYQFFNTLVHELNHLCSHIEEFYCIDPHGEEASYLIGNTTQRILRILD